MAAPRCVRRRASPPEDVIMRVLLAVDRSPCSVRAIKDVSHRAWPPGTEIEVVAVPQTRLPLIYEPTCLCAAAHEEALDSARAAAAAQIAAVQAQLTSMLPASRVTTKLLEGKPAREIDDEARRWHADLIVVGSHGRTLLGRILRGSVSRGVLRHAPCRVEIVASAH
jgi:nucleotide-binding universal stress UspA family protein